MQSWILSLAISLPQISHLCVQFCSQLFSWVADTLQLDVSDTFQLDVSDTELLNFLPLGFFFYLCKRHLQFFPCSDQNLKLLIWLLFSQAISNPQIPLAFLLKQNLTIQLPHPPSLSQASLTSCCQSPSLGSLPLLLLIMATEDPVKT